MRSRRPLETPKTNTRHTSRRQANIHLSKAVDSHDRLTHQRTVRSTNTRCHSVQHTSRDPLQREADVVFPHTRNQRGLPKPTRSNYLRSTCPYIGDLGAYSPALP